MKGIVIHQFGKPEVLTYQELPQPIPQAQEVLVKIYAAGVNPKDCMVRKGKYKIFSGSKFPMQLGEDIAGVVAAVGSKVKDFKVGDQVYGMINGWKVGAYAEFFSIKANELALKPKNLSFVEAAGVPLAAQTAWQALRDLGKLQAGQKILIHGASGGVGVFAVQIAKALGAEVTATCSARNMDFLKSLGADEVIDYTKPDFLATDKRFEVFFDSFGNQKFKTVREILAPKATYVTTIPSQAIIVQTFTTYWASQKARLVVVHSKTKDLDYLRELIEQGKVKSVVDKVFPLPAVQEAHAYIETKRARGKVVLEVVKE
ncbi:MAG: NADP-dependent oxidoreductase [Microscillaceae bacterium]|nr:NADP-dependent oxidoreductase [Microscillaceae bacterium]